MSADDRTPVGEIPDHIQTHVDAIADNLADGDPEIARHSAIALEALAADTHAHLDDRQGVGSYAYGCDCGYAATVRTRMTPPTLLCPRCEQAALEPRDMGADGLFDALLAHLGRAPEHERYVEAGGGDR